VFPYDCNNVIIPAKGIRVGDVAGNPEGLKIQKVVQEISGGFQNTIQALHGAQ